MEPAERSALEESIQASLSAGDHASAVSAAIRGYGPEVLGFLYAQQRDEESANDAFSQTCEDLWKGVASFGQRSSFRTWMYAVARAALHRTRRTTGRREKRQASLSTWEEAAAQVRSATAMIKRTDVKDRFAELRESLPSEDQELLVLRVDRAMEWADLARVLSDRIDLDGEDLKRESARLRKRFQLVKDELRKAAEREGLLG
jgi:RNA polymerase sigma-70 factor (ECF subfamily)